VIEVGVHTEKLDDEKQDAANKELSQQRADSVVVYLVKKGVDGQHVLAAGFGGEQPEGDNSTKQGREQNRRTVFKVIGGTKPEPPPKP
jgi:outer membrane protein OmpA-like peptidoglycan-associated protein